MRILNSGSGVYLKPTSASVRLDQT